MTQIEQVEQALREGPGTSVEIAAATGLPMKHCSHYLRVLLAARRVRRRPFNDGRQGRRPGRVFLYEAL